MLYLPVRGERAQVGHLGDIQQLPKPFALRILPLLSTGCQCTLFLGGIKTYIWDKLMSPKTREVHQCAHRQTSHLWVLVTQMEKHLPAMQETWVRSLGREDPLEKKMATHSSISCLENPMDRGVWWTTVHGAAESDMTERSTVLRGCSWQSVLMSDYEDCLFWGSVCLRLLTGHPRRGFMTDLSTGVWLCIPSVWLVFLLPYVKWKFRFDSLRKFLAGKLWLKKDDFFFWTMYGNRIL